MIGAISDTKILDNVNTIITATPIPIALFKLVVIANVEQIPQIKLQIQGFFCR